MGRTATQLGREFRLNPREMNQLLHKHGFLDGKPNAWTPSELGEKFAKWVDKDNGYGGYAYRDWSFLSWSDGVVDALKASMAANPDGVRPAVSKIAETAADQVGTAAAVSKAGVNAGRTGLGTGGHGLGRNEWVAAAVVVLGIGASTPAARRAWEEKVKPAAARVRGRLRRTPDVAVAGDAAEGDGAGPAS